MSAGHDHGKGANESAMWIALASVKTTPPAKSSSKRAAGKGKNRSDDSPVLPVRQLKAIVLAALSFGVVTALILSWELMFPVPPEQLVEVAWTHECRCARDWMKALRAEGFEVRDFELENLKATRQQWQVPDAIRGCHPATYRGYILDGHVPADTLRRLARERPAAVGLMQVNNLGGTSDDASPASEARFELIDRDGTRRPWS